MSYQIFTMENTPLGEPVVIQAPNEITLAQLVTFFILPSGIQLDVGSVFYWNLLRIEDKS
jgi:predicted ABC-type sugar transport system permease subunit